MILGSYYWNVVHFTKIEIGVCEFIEFVISLKEEYTLLFVSILSEVRIMKSLGRGERTFKEPRL